MASSSAQRQVTTYKGITWYPSYTELEEGANDTTLYAPSSSLLLSCLFTAEGGDAYYYTTFPTPLDMYKCVEEYKDDRTHLLAEVLSTSRPRKLFISFTAPTEDRGMKVIQAFATALTTACLQAHSHYDEGMKRTVSFSPADIRIYQCGESWRVVDNVRGYASARHVVHIQKSLYPLLTQQFGDVVFGNDAHLRLHLPITTPYLYGKGEEGEYKSLNTTLNGLQEYKAAAHGYVFSLSNRPTKELFDAGVMLDSYITSSEKMHKSLAHYCTPPSIFDDNALELPYNYYVGCNGMSSGMYRQGDMIRHHGPWNCPICRQGHPANERYITMLYKSAEERYHYICTPTSLPLSDTTGSVYHPRSSATFPLSEEAYEEYKDGDKEYSYPPPKSFEAFRDKEGTAERFFTSGATVVYDRSDPATAVTVTAVGTSNENSGKKWSQVVRPALQPPFYELRTTEAARTRAYHHPVMRGPSFDYYIDNEVVCDDWSETPDDRPLLSDAAAIVNTLIKLTHKAADIAFFYKLIGGNTIIDWYTGDKIKISGKIKVRIFLPSAYQEAEEAAEESGKKPKKVRPLNISFSPTVLMSGDYLKLDCFCVTSRMEELEEENPMAYARALQKQQQLLEATFLHNIRGPRIPKYPSVIPFFHGDRIPLNFEDDINMSKGFPCNPSAVANPSLDPRTRITSQFPILRKLYLHGYCRSDPQKAHVVWSHQSYSLNHLNDPQTFKALFFGGPQGSMKSAFSTNLKAIYGESMVSVSPHQVCGKFNTALEGSIIVTLDEPSGSSSKNYNDTGLYKDAMKKIIAGDGTLSIEGKGKNVYSVKNLCNVIISTNHYNTGLLDAEDKRRFIVLATRCLGITKHGILITSDDESFSDPHDAETAEPITLEEDDTVAMVKERFLEAYCQEVNQTNFPNEFARYLLDYGKVHDTSFIRSYIQPYDDVARAEMLNLTSTSCAEFFEDFLSEEYTAKTSLNDLIPREEYKKPKCTGANKSYYLFIESFYAEYVAWFKKKYPDGKVTNDKCFRLELSSWCAMNFSRMSYHCGTKGRSNRIQDLRKGAGDVKLKVGVQFVSAAVYRLEDLNMLPTYTPPEKKEATRNEAPDAPSPFMKGPTYNIIPADQSPEADRIKRLEEMFLQQQMMFQKQIAEMQMAHQKQMAEMYQKMFQTSKQ